MRIWFHLIAGLVAIVFTAGFIVGMISQGVTEWLACGLGCALFGVF